MCDVSALFTPFTPFHRIVMAPLTRVRGTTDRIVPASTAVEYYAQRSTKNGLLITEGCPVSPESQYEYAPGIYTKEQEQGWAKIVEAVHEKGGKISLQLWHTGRMAHASWAKHDFLQSLGRPLPSVSSSSIPPLGFTRDPTGKKVSYETPPPRSLTREEIYTRLVSDFSLAAQAARRCNFDFVEIHGAHGYLFDQFFCDGVNKRTDEFGTQTLENRTRALGLVLKAVIEAMGGSDRVAIRISPTYKDTFFYQSCHDSNPEVLYPSIIKWLNQFNLGYLLLTEPRWKGSRDNANPRTDKSFSLPLRNSWARDVYKGTIISCGGFTPSMAAAGIRAGLFDAVAFGRLFLSNPDLVERIRTGSKLNVYNAETFYLRDNVVGYIDYPDLALKNKYASDKYDQMEEREFTTSVSKL